MEQFILVGATEAGRFTARAVTIPEIQATATTEAEAIALVRQQLTVWLKSNKIVKVDVAVHPLLQVAGMFANDPTYDDFLEEIRLAREADGAP